MIIECVTSIHEALSSPKYWNSHPLYPAIPLPYSKHHEVCAKMFTFLLQRGAQLILDFQNNPVSLDFHNLPILEECSLGSWSSHWVLLDSSNNLSSKRYKQRIDPFRIFCLFFQNFFKTYMHSFIYLGIWEPRQMVWWCSGTIPGSGLRKWPLMGSLGYRGYVVTGIQMRDSG